MPVPYHTLKLFLPLRDFNGSLLLSLVAAYVKNTYWGVQFLILSDNDETILQEVLLVQQEECSVVIVVVAVFVIVHYITPIYDVGKNALNVKICRR